MVVDTQEGFKFTGWRRIIYYLGWLNVLNLVFWVVMFIYNQRYKHSTREELKKKKDYVVYFFGYISIIIIILIVVVELLLFIELIQR